MKKKNLRNVPELNDQTLPPAAMNRDKKKEERERERGITVGKSTIRRVHLLKRPRLQFLSRIF